MSRYVSFAWSLHTEGSDDDGQACTGASAECLPGILSMSLLSHRLDTSAKSIVATHSWPADTKHLGQVTTAVAYSHTSSHGGDDDSHSVAAAEFLLHAEHESVGQSSRLLLDLEPVSADGPASSSTVSPSPSFSDVGKWSAGFLVRVEVEGKPPVDVLLVVSVVCFPTGALLSSNLDMNVASEHLLQAYVKHFKALVVQPRWTTIKAQFTTAIDDILVLEERLDAAERERDAIAAAATPPSVAVGGSTAADAPPKSSDVPPDASPQQASTGDQQATQGDGSASPLREEKSLRAVIRAKDSELFVLRARVQAMEEARKAELENLRHQLARMKLKRTELVEKGEQKSSQPSGKCQPQPKGAKKGTGEAEGGKASLRPPSLSANDVANPASAGNGTAAPAGSRQPSPTVRQRTPLRQHVRTVSDYSSKPQPPPAPPADEERPRPVTTQQYDEDRRQRLDRLEESFARLQSRHYSARAVAQASPYVDPITTTGATGTARTASPLRVPDNTAALRTFAVKRTATSQSIGSVVAPDGGSGGEAASSTQQPLGDDTSCKVPPSAANVSSQTAGAHNTTSGTRLSSASRNSSQQRASSPLLRISPGRFRTVLDPTEKKPPMHRR